MDKLLKFWTKIEVYNENRIICEDENLQNARVFLTYAVGKVLKIGASLLGIQMPDKM